MANKPDFIVDPSGNVRDVRGQKSEAASSPEVSQNSGSGGSFGGGGGGWQATSGSYSKSTGSPGGVIFIPIGLILTLIMLLVRCAAGGSGTSAQNSYSQAGVSSLDLGLSFYDDGKYDMAIAEFNAAIAEDPNMSAAYNDRGLAYCATGENDKALADFNKAIELDPGPGGAGSYSNRGALYLSLGNHEQSLADLNKAIELSPRLAKAYHNRALTYMDLDDVDQAIVDFSKAIELTPEEMFSRQATMESRLPTESALSIHFMEGIMDREEYADLPKTYAGRAMAYFIKGEFEKANADLEKATALGLDPNWALQIGAQNPLSLVVPQAGHWEGTSYHSGDQGTVSFEVGEDGLVHDFQLDLPLGPNDSCQVTAGDVWLQPDGSFYFESDAGYTRAGVIVQGKFETTTVSGDFNQHIECVSTTGEVHNGDLSAGANWKAEWISGPIAISEPSGVYDQMVGTAVYYEPTRTNISALAIDPVAPSTLYVGTPGGVFKSTDGGERWNAAGDGMPASYISAIVIDPTQTDILYAGTSEGIFRSNDGAGHWKSITSDPLYPPISAFVIDPQTPETLYAGTMLGVFKSTDSGQTWQESSMGLAQSLMVRSLAIDPATPATLYVGTSDSVFKTEDGGGLWYCLNAGLAYSYVQTLAVDAILPGTVYAGTGAGLFKSIDGGASWSSSGVEFQPVVTIALDPIMPSTVYIGRSDGLFRSTDGGTNWDVIYGSGTPTQINIVAVDPLNPGALYVGTSDGLFRVTAGGSNWVPLNNGLPQPEE